MKFDKKTFGLLALLGLAAALDAMAGTDATFATVVTNLNNYLTGSLGKVFAIGSLGVGLAVAIVRQSLMSVVTGVGIALAGSIGPGVLQGIFTATI